MVEKIKSLADIYIVSYEGIATLAIILIMLLKLFINRSVGKLQFKKMMLGIPSEITFLLIGFLLPAMISKDTTRNGE